MSEEVWTWDEELHPDVVGVFSFIAPELAWCDRLETAPSDPVVGKVLCVCAALEIAREVMAAQGDNNQQAADALELLACWIDDPTEDRFKNIYSLIFGDESTDLGPEGVGSWALRTSTSSVGNYEAGWALSGTCHAAQRAGFSEQRLREVSERAVLARRGGARF